MRKTNGNSKRIIIAGARTFQDYDRLKSVADVIVKRLKEENEHVSITILSGQARGADQLGERFAMERGLNIALYPADWNKYGRSAGFFRNRKMAEDGHILIVFWNGRSKGTRNMIREAKMHELEIKLVFFDLREE